MSARTFTAVEAWSALAGVAAIGAALARGEGCGEHVTDTMLVQLSCEVEGDALWCVTATAARDDGPVIEQRQGHWPMYAVANAAASLSARLP